MKTLLRVFSIIHGFMALLFACAALMLVTIAAKVGWLAFAAGLTREAAQGVIEGSRSAGGRRRRPADRANHHRGGGHPCRPHQCADARKTISVAVSGGRRRRAGHRRTGCYVQGRA